jgi:hypothetical protein
LAYNLTGPGGKRRTAHPTNRPQAAYKVHHTMQANPTTTTAPATLAALALAAPADPTTAALAAWLASAPADPTPAMLAVASNGRPGAAQGKATPSGTVSADGSKLWRYTTSAVANGRAYKGNIGGMYHTLRLVVAASLAGQGPMHHTSTTAWARTAGMLAPLNADRVWCGLADLADLATDGHTYMGHGLPLVAVVRVGNANMHQAGPGAARAALACALASAAMGRPVWACPLDKVALCATTGALVGPLPADSLAALAGLPLPVVAPVADPAPAPAVAVAVAVADPAPADPAPAAATAVADPAPAVAATTNRRRNRA